MPSDRPQKPGRSSSSGKERPSEDRRTGWFGRELPLETETTRFILVNALDLFMTFLLLYFSNRGMLQTNVVESNPAARFVISRFGTTGLVFFKFGIVAVVVLIAQVVATKRPTTAKWLLNLGALFVAAVVVYSLLIMLRHRF